MGLCQAGYIKMEKLTGKIETLPSSEMSVENRLLGFTHIYSVRISELAAWKSLCSDKHSADEIF